MVAPSTWLKNAISDKTGERQKQSDVYKLMNLIDEEMLDGLAKHVQNKEKDLFAFEQRLSRREQDLENQEKELFKRQEMLDAKERAISEMANISSRRGKDAVLFANEMLNVLNQLDYQGQESMSYIMWAYLLRKSTNAEKHSPFNEDDE